MREFYFAAITDEKHQKLNNDCRLVYAN